MEMYRQRWTIEGVFQQLTEDLHCEIDTLGYPKAALFGSAWRWWRTTRSPWFTARLNSSLIETCRPDGALGFLICTCYQRFTPLAIF